MRKNLAGFFNTTKEVITLYFNPSQKYIMALLAEYGALKKSQLEFMVQCHISIYISNLDGYIRQLRQGKEIKVIPCDETDMYVCRPDCEPDIDMINAFDIIITFNDKISAHKKCKEPAKILFFTENAEDADGNKRICEVYIIPIHRGYEKEVISYADKNFNHEYKKVFFLIDYKNQMEKVRPLCNHTFAVRTKNGLQFFIGKQNKEKEVT